jgi:ubiquinone/menaquinone biosynthesis C-methylase UbiE
MAFEPTDEPYDTWAEAYRDWWGPVIAPSAVRLLDRLTAAGLGGRSFELVDVGTGTGALAIAALERWPRARAIGVDPASRMLEMAADAARRRAPGVADRLRLAVGSADRLPLADGEADVAVSSFVIQLVPSRAAALREIARVLRPGGVLAVLSWQAEELAFEPDEAFMLAVDDLDIDAPPLGGGHRPYTSPNAAAAELRRTGFERVSARTEWLEHRYTPESYLQVLEHWVESELFGRLGFARRHRLRKEALRRMRRLPAEAFVWRRPLVSVLAYRRSGPLRH